MEARRDLCLCGLARRSESGMMATTVKLVAALAVVAGLGGCGSGGHVQLFAHAPGGQRRSTAGPPIVVCGQTLWSGAMTPLVYHVPPTGGPVPTTVVGGVAPLIVRVAQGCKQGADVSVTPAQALRAVRQAKATDGRPVAIVFAGRIPGTATITVHHHGQLVGTLSVLVESSGR